MLTSPTLWEGITDETGSNKARDVCQSRQLLRNIQSNMFKTYFNAAEKIWTGPEDEFEFEKNRNFGQSILNELAADDSDRVMQVNIQKLIVTKWRSANFLYWFFKPI